MRVARTCTALACSVLLVAGCGASADPAKKPLSAGGLTCPDRHRDCTSRGTVRWSLALDGPYLVSTRFDLPETKPARNGPEGTDPTATATGDLLVYAEDDLVRAVDPRTGRIRWRTQVGTGVPGPKSAPEQDKNGMNPPPIVASGLVCVFVDVGLEDQANHWLFVLDAATGRQIGGFVPPKDLGHLQTVSGGRLIWAGDRRVTATDPRTGKTAWRTPVGPYFHVAQVGDVLYLDHKKQPYHDAQRVDVRTGRRLPALPVKANGRVLPDSLPGILFVTTELPMGVAALDARTNRRLWWHSGFYDGDHSVVVALDRLADPPVAYLRGTNTDIVQAVNARTGALLRDNLPANRFERWGGAARGVALSDTDDLMPQGVDALSGTSRWRLGDEVGFRQLASWSGSDPAIAVGLTCAADGVRPARANEPVSRTACGKPRLVAVNW